MQAFLLSASLVLAAAQPPADSQRPAAPSKRFGVGPAVLVTTEAYAGLDASSEARAIPLIELETPRFFIQGTGAGITLWEQGPWRVRSGLQWRFAGFNVEDGPLFAGMESRSGTLDADVQVSWSQRSWGLDFRVSHDVLSRYDDIVADFGINFPQRFGSWIVVPSLDLSWESDGYVDYYFGVRAEEATASRPAYRGESAWTWGAGLRTVWPFAERWSLFGLAKVERLPSGITDSPLVDDDWRAVTILGTTYRIW